jgi:hypothetical protein
MLYGSPKLVAIDEQPNHHVVHGRRFGKADCPAYQPLDPRAQVDVLALDLLGVCLPHRVLLSLYMSLVGTPAVGKIARDAKGRPLNLSLFVEDQNDPNIGQTPPFWLCMQ